MRCGVALWRRCRLVLWQEAHHQGVGWAASPAALRTALRWSHVSNNKVEGYYRLQARDVKIPSDSYEVMTSRGSGPGGQGADHSSNKVTLRLKVERILDDLDDATYSNLVRQQSESGALTSDGEFLVVAAYDHRSALKNKEACLDKIKDMIVAASWVPPIEADPIKMPSSTIQQRKVDRRKKGNALKMRRTARSGGW